MATERNADAVVARTVKILLAARDLNQTDLADRIGMDYSAMSRSIRGRRHWKLDELFDIAEFLGVDVCTLLRGEFTIGLDGTVR